MPLVIRWNFSWLLWALCTSAAVGQTARDAIDDRTDRLSPQQVPARDDWQIVKSLGVQPAVEAGEVDTCV